MTFSIVAHDARSGQFGVAIASSSPAVASRCAFARPGVGAAVTQNVTNPALGTAMLERLALGDSAASAVAAAIAGERYPAYRQLIAVDRRSGTAVHSGERTLGIWAASQGAACAAGGNLLAVDSVPRVMVGAFQASAGALGDRLIGALQAGVAEGGEVGPIHSAGLLVVHDQAWPFAEVRVDWLDEGCPVAAIARAWDVYAPQADDYVTRALNPSDAPSFGVPGDSVP
jgi:uncharacterized Ntn-hydrolase superfamily protein